MSTPTEETYPAPEAIEIGSMPPVPGPAPSNAPRIAIIAGTAALALVLLMVVRSITARSAGTDEATDDEGAEE